MNVSTAEQKPLRVITIRVITILVLAGVCVTWAGAHRSATLAASGSTLNGSPISAVPDHFRVGTYNIDGGVGADGRLDLARIASDIQGCDLVGLQEVHGRGIFESRDQAEIVGEQLREPWLFAPAERQWWHDSFGNGVICRLPCNHWERLPVTGDAASNHRSLLRIDLPLSTATLHVLIVHLPTTNDRPSQCAIVRSMFFDLAEPVLLLGDLNCKPGDPWIESLRHERGVVDGVGMYAEAEQPGHVDWILARGLNCNGGGWVDHHASDHPFYFNDFSLPQVDRTPGN